MQLSKEKYARKRIHNGSSVQNENSVTRDNCSVTLVTRFVSQFPALPLGAGGGVRSLIVTVPILSWHSLKCLFIGFSYFYSISCYGLDMEFNYISSFLIIALSSFLSSEFWIYDVDVESARLHWQFLRMSRVSKLFRRRCAVKHGHKKKTSICTEYESLGCPQLKCSTPRF